MKAAIDLLFLDYYKKRTRTGCVFIARNLFTDGRTVKKSPTQKRRTFLSIRINYLSKNFKLGCVGVVTVCRDCSTHGNRCFRSFYGVQFSN